MVTPLPYHYCGFHMYNSLSMRCISHTIHFIWQNETQILAFPLAILSDSLLMPYNHSVHPLPLPPHQLIRSQPAELGPCLAPTHYCPFVYNYSVSKHCPRTTCPWPCHYRQGNTVPCIVIAFAAIITAQKPMITHSQIAALLNRADMSCVVIISNTVTSHECQGISNHWPLNCLFNRLFRLYLRKNSENKAQHYWSFLGGSTGDQWIPLTKG